MKRKIKAGDSVMVKYDYRYNPPVSSHKVHVVAFVEGDRLRLVGHDYLMSCEAFELHK